MSRGSIKSLARVAPSLTHDKTLGSILEEDEI